MVAQWQNAVLCEADPRGRFKVHVCTPLWVRGACVCVPMAGHLREGVGHDVKTLLGGMIFLFFSFILSLSLMEEMDK